MLAQYLHVIECQLWIGVQNLCQSLLIQQTLWNLNHLLEVIIYRSIPIYLTKFCLFSQKGGHNFGSISNFSKQD